MITQIVSETIYTQEEIDNAVPEYDKIEAAFNALSASNKAIVKVSIKNLYESGACSFIPLVCGFMVSNDILMNAENLKMAYDMLCGVK